MSMMLAAFQRHLYSAARPTGRDKRFRRVADSVRLPHTTAVTAHPRGHATAPQQIDPKRCHFVKDCSQPNYFKHEFKYFSMYFELPCDTIGAVRPGWELPGLSLSKAAPICDRDGIQLQPGNTYQFEVGKIRVSTSPPLLRVHYFGIHEELQGRGYGTAFAKRLSLLVTKNSFGFSNSCTTVCLQQVDSAFPFWRKAVGIRHFMKSADADFMLGDILIDAPNEEALRLFWAEECGHGDRVVDVLVSEWKKRVKRAAKRAHSRQQ